MATVKVQIVPKLIPVFTGPADVRGAYGGRGSGKTRSFAKMAAVRGYIYGNSGIKGQILCARQFMNSLEDSSLEECKRAIEDEPFLAEYYEIGEKYIKSKDGNIWFSFAGLDRNIASVKSKGRILICWIDEAEPVTDHAFRVLVPTLREEGSDWNAELWVTWNPGRKNAAVERRYRKSNDPLVKIAKVNWKDNPRFPNILERERKRCELEQPDEYDHIWEGEFGNIQGSILARWVNEAYRSLRVHNDVVFDRGGAGIEVSCDLGFRDTASFWYWQRCPGGRRVLAYDGDSGLDADEWIPRVKNKIIDLGASGNLGKIWLPHDAKAKTFQSRHTTIEKFLQAFGKDSCEIVPISKKSDQISAARSVLPKCEFHKDLCESGLDGLLAWEYLYNDDLKVFSREPLHNWASHPSDAFCYGAQVMAEIAPKLQENKPDFSVTGHNGRIVTHVALDAMWEDSRKQHERY